MADIYNVSIADLKKVALKKDYLVFEKDDKPFNLNIWGIRSQDNTPNTFNDLFVYFWRYNNIWNLLKFTGTTDPGLYWLEHPGNPMGTAILKESQWRGMWEKGLHRGKYPALVQKGICEVIRDADRDKELDFDNGVIDKGLFGINHHRANSKHSSVEVNKWSAGCQVQDDPHNFDVSIKIVDEAIETGWANSFTYTLIGEGDL